jgi:hypothetical protein
MFVFFVCICSDAGVVPGIKALKVSGPLRFFKNNLSMNEQLQLFNRYKDL